MTITEKSKGRHFGGPQKWLIYLLIPSLFVAIWFVLWNWSYFAVQLEYHLRSFQTMVSQPTVYSYQKHTQVPVGSCSDLDLPPSTIYIPALKLTAPIVEPSGLTETDFQTALYSGVAHYPGTAQVGSVGNAYLFGHSSDSLFNEGSYKTIFALLPQLTRGDLIYVSDQISQTFCYQMESAQVVWPNNMSVLNQDSSQQILSLQTSYPLGTALKRYVVVARLIPTNP